MISIVRRISRLMGLVKFNGIYLQVRNFIKKLMQYKSNNIVLNSIPSNLQIIGDYDSSCKLNLTEESLNAIKNKVLKLSIHRHGGKATISNLNISFAALRGHVSIFVGNDNTEVIFGEGVTGAYNLRLWRNSRVVIGNKTTSNGIKIVCDQSEFITGEDCMFSDGILVQSADQHGLVDLTTGKISNNKYRKTAIGDHVWLGRACTLTADISIGDGSIIGTGSVVTKNIPPMVIAVGVPASVKKTDFTWSRYPLRLDEFSIKYVKKGQIVS